MSESERSAMPWGGRNREEEMNGLSTPVGLDCCLSADPANRPKAPYSNKPVC